MSGSDIDSLPSNKDIAKLGEIDSSNAIEFERSFMNYFTLSSISPSHLEKFGYVKFGEIDNKLLDNYGKL